MAVISEDFIKRLSLGDKAELIVNDSRLVGFAIRVRRKVDGRLSIAFFVSQELPAKNGKRRRRKIGIGPYPTFSAEHARAEAQRMLQAVKRGDDPQAERAAKKARPTFEKLAEEFEASHIPSLKRATQWDYRGRINRRLLPVFRDSRVADITAREIADWHRKHGREHPTDANRCVAVLSMMMTFAIREGWRTDNPCRGIKRFRENARDIWLDEHDNPKFVRALLEQSGPYIELLQFLTVSGWRIGEARGLTWDMVDLKRLVARLPDTKTGPSERSLSADAATIIANQPHRIGFVFSKKNGRFALDYRHTLSVLRTVCEAAEIDPITPHVLRHSAATWAAVSGAQAHEIREAFGWQTLAMTARYVSKAEMLGRRGVERAAGAINIFQKPAAPVEQLQSRKF